MSDDLHTPLTAIVTKEHLQQCAREYLTELYGKPGDGNDADKWHERFGLLCGFIDEQFQSTPCEAKLAEREGGG